MRLLTSAWCPFSWATTAFRSRSWGCRRAKSGCRTTLRERARCRGDLRPVPQERPALRRGGRRRPDLDELLTQQARLADDRDRVDGDADTPIKMALDAGPEPSGHRD